MSRKIFFGVLLLLLSGLVLSGCGSDVVVENNEVVEAEGELLAVDTSAQVVTGDAESGEIGDVVLGTKNIDVVIVDNKLDVDTVSMDLGNSYDVTFHNKGSESIRLDVGIRTVVFSADIEAGEYSVVRFDAEVAGQYSIVVDGAPIGSIVVN